MKPETLNSYKTRIFRSLVYLQTHLDETISIEDMAAVACFSPCHFHRIFRGMVGESVAEHIRRLRLERSAQLLRRTEKPVIEIALAAGYETHESFTRAFGAAFGEPPSAWNWKLMIRVPDFITEKEVAGAIEKLKAKGKPKEVGGVKLEEVHEGNCVQVLHLGPYDNERPTIERMHAFAQERGLKFHGLHHEIYLSDPRRVAPAKLRTILRHPVR